MRIVENGDDTIDVYVRQSWINDAVMCAERGRQGIIHPEWSTPNDATIIGTAVHAAIEADLTREGDPVDVGLFTLETLLAEPVRMVKYNAAQCRAYVPELFDQYVRGLRPHVRDRVDEVEWSFEFLFDEFKIGHITVRVHGKGTADLVDTGCNLWDWKTSGQKYRPAEKQKTAVQPTMYAAAAVALKGATWPVTFRYGVMVRDGKAAQIVTVQRTERHLTWLREIVRPFIRAAVVQGTDESWPKNDTHYLCSETWCSYWSVCKGAALSPSDNETPPQEAQ